MKKKKKELLIQTRSSSSGLTPLENPSRSLLFSSSSTEHRSCIKHKLDFNDFNSLARNADFVAIATASWKKTGQNVNIA